MPRPVLSAVPRAKAAPLDAPFVRAYYDQRVAAASAYLRTRWLSTPADCKRYFQTLLALDRALQGVMHESVLEIGCGPGVWTAVLAAHARRVLAVDISAGMLAQFPPDLLAAGAVHRVCADFAQAPLASDAVDAIVSVRAFEYFPDKAAAAAQLARVGRDGCALLVITKNPAFGRADERAGPRADGARARLHSGQIAPADLVAALRRAGFTDLRVRPVTLVRTQAPAVWGLCDVIQALTWTLPRAADLPVWLRRHAESYAVSGVLRK